MKPAGVHVGQYRALQVRALAAVGQQRGFIETNQQRRIRVARDVYRWRRPLDKERLIALGGRDSGLPAVLVRLDGRPLEDRGALYLRHGEPDDRQRPGSDECGFWYYHRDELPGDLDGDLDADRGDTAILLGFRNKPASACTACDLDRDGLVTVLDARKLVLLCSRPGCAVN